MNSNVNKQILLYMGLYFFLMGIAALVAIFYKIYQVWFSGTEIDLMSWLFMIGFAAVIDYLLLRQNK